jgi:hypothetical protein
VLAKTLEMPSLNNYTPGSLNVIFNQGNGNFSAPMSLDATDLLGLTVEDYDNDGLFDIAVSLYGTKRVVVFHNELPSTRGFSKTAEVTGTFGARVVTFADVDGDGCKDLVALFGGSVLGPGTQVVVSHGHQNLLAGKGSMPCP